MYKIFQRIVVNVLVVFILHQMKYIVMQDKNILKELIYLNGGESNIAYTESNMWFSENPKYADFVAELKENIQNNDIFLSIIRRTE